MLLEDGRTFYDIQKETPLHLALRLLASMQIIVKPLAYKTIGPDVKASGTYNDIKATLADKQLEDGRTLSEYETSPACRHADLSEDFDKQDARK